MSNLKPITLLKSAALAAALALAPAVHAESRDTGVGLDIAAQGNQALALIRADVRQAVKSLKPVLPARPVRAQLAYGSAPSVAATQRSAK